MKKSILFFLVFSMMLNVACASRESDKLQSEADNEEISQVVASDSEILSRSEAISDSIVELYGIDNATAIIFNDDVLLGVILAEGQELTEDMSNTIVDTIKKDNPQTDKIYISINKKTFDKVDDIVMNLLEGKPYDDYVDEISKMINKVEKEK